MEWIELVIETKSEAVEYVSACLINAGVNGFQIEDDAENRRFLEENSDSWDYLDDELIAPGREGAFISFYASADSYGRELIALVKNGLDRLRLDDYGVDFGSLELKQNSVDDTDWLNNWKKYYKPFKVGKNIIIRPYWEEFEPSGELVFTINPGHLFGTGLHQTTQMCMAALEELVKKGSVVADIGCGSGILSVLSLMLGAEKAYACDIESGAAGIAFENAALNNIPQKFYTVEIGDILTEEEMRKPLMKRGFDIVAANIVADVIIPLADYVPAMLKDGGYFISSGIISARARNVKAALSENFELIEETEKDGWVCLVARIKDYA